MQSNEITNERLTEMIVEQNRWLAEEEHMESTQKNAGKQRAQKLPARYINTYREITSNYMRANVDLIINGHVADRFVSEGYSHERVLEASIKLAKQAKRAFVPTGKILDYGEVSPDRFQLLAAR